MSTIRNQLEQAKADYFVARYPGDLAGELLTVHLSLESARRREREARQRWWWAGGAGGAVAAAVVAAFLVMGQPDAGPDNGGAGKAGSGFVWYPTQFGLPAGRTARGGGGSGGQGTLVDYPVNLHLGGPFINVPETRFQFDRRAPGGSPARTAPGIQVPSDDITLQPDVRKLDYTVPAN
jgi:hypothetical protein